MKKKNYEKIWMYYKEIQKCNCMRNGCPLSVLSVCKKKPP